MRLTQFQPLLIASLLPLLIIGWFAKDLAGQVDFWLMWLIAMTLVGLPLVFAEIALAQRSGTSPLVGLASLTREADVTSVWRGFGWLTMLLLMIVSGHLLASSADILHGFVGNMAKPALLAIMVLVVMGLSFAKHLAGWLSLVFAVVAIGLNIAQSGVNAWQMTDSSLAEWSIAVLLSLVCVGAGTGLFWQARAKQIAIHGKEDKAVASRTVLPIWSFQLVVGAVVAMSLNAQSSPNIVSTLAMCAGSAYLLNLATEQVSLKFSKTQFNFLALVLLSVITLGLSMLPVTVLNVLLVLVSFVSAIWLSIFAGWQMKISHLRKSLNFGSEAIYNIWRIAVRIIVPLAIIVALVGFVMGLGK